jgi:hypothetical protein
MGKIDYRYDPDPRSRKRIGVLEESSPEDESEWGRTTGESVGAGSVPAVRQTLRLELSRDRVVRTRGGEPVDWIRQADLQRAWPGHACHQALEENGGWTAPAEEEAVVDKLFDARGTPLRRR